MSGVMPTFADLHYDYGRVSCETHGPASKARRNAQSGEPMRCVRCADQSLGANFERTAARQAELREPPWSGSD